MKDTGRSLTARARSNGLHRSRQTAAQVWNFRAITAIALAAASRLTLAESNALSSVTDYPESLRRSRSQQHAAIYLVHVALGLSQRRTGRLFRCDRTSVRYACARIEDARDCPTTDILLDALTVALTAYATAFGVHQEGSKNALTAIA